MVEPVGVLVLHKPAGVTSHDCVSAVRRLYGLRRVGHAGTLDPAATGVLVLCLGRATRLLEYLTGGQKSYHGEVVFGVTTDSYDADGTVLAERDAGHLTREAIEAALPALTGEIQQQPPMVSAKKVGGRKLVDLHRRGQSLEVQAVPVTVYRLTLTSFTPGTHPRASLEVDCGAGTYIRSLAHDLGAALGVGAHLAALVRTRVGAHDLAQAVTIAELGELSPEARRTRLLPPEAAVAALPRVVLRDEALLPLVQGKRLDESHLLSAPPAAEAVAIMSSGGRLLAVAVPHEEPGGLQPRKVLLDPAEVPRPTTPE